MPKEKLLRTLAALFFTGGCLTIGYCAVAYFQMGIYQASAARRFLDAPPLPALPGTALIAEPDGSPIARIEIPRIGVSAMVLEGITPRSLKLAVGHVPGTAFPGASGNVALAGHRDTFFRKLQDIRGRDAITLTTMRGSYRYSVESVQIADPSDVRSLQPTREPVLTLITCYPFYYVGPAPRRFIVRARQIADNSR